MEAIINVSDRNYESWTFVHPDTNDILEIATNINPGDAKVFHGDKLLVYENTINVLETNVKADTLLTGILVLSDGKTYGRTENKKRLLYKCVPYNKRYPAFIVPYHLRMGLSKYLVNKYVVFKYVDWKGKHPLGLLTHVLGDVNDINVYGEYLLYSYGYHEQNYELINAIKHVDETNILNEIVDKNPQIIDRRSEYIFSIDGENTTDYDDALSITDLNTGEVRISIYTTNLCRWLDHLQLWEYVDKLKQTETIYLPHRKKQLFCDKLVEMCSLIEKRDRLSFTIDYMFKDGVCINTTFCETFITVKKNHVYESEKLTINSHYTRLYEYTKKMLDNNIENSRDLVAYWMIKINSDAGAYLYKNKRGIFVKTTSSSNGIPSPYKDRLLYAIINQVRTEYVAYSEDDPMFHEMLQTFTYAHISSEMRRVVDVYNKREMMYKKEVKYKEGLEKEMKKKMKKRSMKEGKKRGYIVWVEGEEVKRYEVYIVGEGIVHIKSEKTYKEAVLCEVYKMEGLEEKTKIEIISQE